MDAKGFLSDMVPTVKDLLLIQGFRQECEVLQLSNMFLVEDEDSFGHECYFVVVDVQTDKYISLRQYKPIEDVENVILSAFDEATKGGQMIYKVTVRPNSKVQATLFESGTYQGWRNGYFRMFISHITSKKKQASNPQIRNRPHKMTQRSKR